MWPVEPVTQFVWKFFALMSVPNTLPNYIIYSKMAFKMVAEHISLPTDLTDNIFVWSVLVTVTAEVTNSIISFLLQLFRRVAAALPGMESMQETSKEGSILSVSSKPKQFNKSDPMSKCCALVCNQVTLLHSTSHLIIYKSARTDWVLVLLHMTSSTLFPCSFCLMYSHSPINKYYFSTCFISYRILCSIFTKGVISWC